ncbi:hypothetical protein GCK72_022925 [Caenorhabditis remanei]|uniref:Protein kinase domain-containing protein n=1 Tax=Caenorhabditis remanei TaxID=31234 RepID=A0A6A5FVJ2_CAERE|nr:hypothetical protein GCK72_022925 [Caenorhabditis remanei]KAF1746469.1 hypothetical protein GCK72_022925 [Caenorhabditis remanei]
MTNRIECTPLDIALVDDKVVAAVTTDSLTLFSTEFSTMLENHKAESVDHVYTDGKNVHMIGKEPMLFTIDVESSRADTQKILDGIARITGSDFSRKENKLLICSNDSKSSECFAAIYDANNRCVVSKFKTTGEVTAANYRSNHYEIVIAGKDGVWRLYDVRGSWQNYEAVITNITDLPNHKTRFFHKYGTNEESGHHCVDVLDNKIFATGCKSGIVVQSAEFNVPDFAQHTGRIKQAIRMQKKRLADDAEYKEQEQFRVRWETNAKKTDGINVFDSHLSEENFIIGDILGSGTFGSVFKATSKNSGKPFALKVMTNRCSLYTEKFVAERELLIQREMTHKNIVPIIRARCFGEKKAMLLSVDEMAWITECVACGLTYIHRRGILHRDLKPHNMLYNYGGLVKISDFGISTDKRDATYCGTPGYMAPEIICRQKQTAAVDCYSLGVTPSMQHRKNAIRVAGTCQTK